MQKCCLSCPPGHWFVVCFILKTAFAQLGPILSEVELGVSNLKETDLQFYYYFYYCKIASSNMSHLEVHVCFYRLLVKGIFCPYVL